MHMCRPCRNAHIAETPKLSISRRVSVSVRHSLNGKKAYRTEKLLGYSMLELRRHLERQFVKGMSWDNMKQWHIDHIVPLASFNFQDATSCEFKQAWSLSNLRPLWAKENLSKNARRDFLL